MLNRLGRLVLVLAMLSGTAASAEPVKLGLDVWLGYGPFWVADKQEYFAKHGVEVALEIIRLDDGIRAAMQNGDIDLAASPTNGLILDVNRGIAQKAFLVLDTSLQADAIMAGPEIAKIADLKGKTIAYEAGTTSDLLLGYALKTHGMSFDDVESIHMPALETGSALATGKVDAAVTYEPYLSAVLAENDDLRVVYSAADKPGLISDVATAAPEWIESHSPEIQGIIRAWDDAVKFIGKHPEEGLATIAEAIGSPVEEIKPAFDGLRLYTAADNIELLDGTFEATVVDIGDIMQTIHPREIKTVPSPDELLSLDDLRAVAE